MLGWNCQCGISSETKHSRNSGMALARGWRWLPKLRKRGRTRDWAPGIHRALGQKLGWGVSKTVWVLTQSELSERKKARNSMAVLNRFKDAIFVDDAFLGVRKPFLDHFRCFVSVEPAALIIQDLKAAKNQLKSTKNLQKPTKTCQTPTESQPEPSKTSRTKGSDHISLNALFTLKGPLYLFLTTGVYGPQIQNRWLERPQSVDP